MKAGMLIGMPRGRRRDAQEASIGRGRQVCKGADTNSARNGQGIPIMMRIIRGMDADRDA